MRTHVEVFKMVWNRFGCFVLSLFVSRRNMCIPAFFRKAKMSFVKMIHYVLLTWAGRDSWLSYGVSLSCGSCTSFQRWRAQVTTRARPKASREFKKKKLQDKSLYKSCFILRISGKSNAFCKMSATALQYINFLNSSKIITCHYTHKRAHIFINSWIVEWW